MVVARNQTGICPYCKNSNRFEGVQYYKYPHNYDFPNRELINGVEDKTKLLRTCRCTACQEIIILFGEQMICPLGAMRPSAPKEVPTDISQDFNEASLIEPLSSKASAALARRCLQSMLHEQGISKNNLSQEIEKAMETLPSHLSEAIDAVRNIGNFASHPIKSTNSGQIIDVEKGETEWILDVLEQLFDFYYVQPTLTKLKKKALDEKLKSANKPPNK